MRSSPPEPRGGVRVPQRRLSVASRQGYQRLRRAVADHRREGGKRGRRVDRPATTRTTRTRKTARGTRRTHRSSRARTCGPQSHRVRAENRHRRPLALRRQGHSRDRARCREGPAPRAGARGHVGPRPRPHHLADQPPRRRVRRQRPGRARPDPRGRQRGRRERLPHCPAPSRGQRAMDSASLRRAARSRASSWKHSGRSPRRRRMATTPGNHPRRRPYPYVCRR
mmetsp:Transcript_78740/g.227685  ORF Transcript_78740/g.227685 Transcript_78740/m.227685 type:complete len:225 (-) Transcript_78740:868-1542(-)